MASECEHRPRILAVDDDQTNLMLLQRILERNGYEVLLADNGGKAIVMAREEMPDLILLDIRMPEMDGFEVCRRLRCEPETTEIPIIFVTAEGREDENLTAGFDAGCNDYITKPFSKVDLLSRVRVNLEQVALRESYKQLAMADSLTGLDNRRQLYQRVPEIVAGAKRHRWPLSVIMCDIDAFKPINDTYGHQFGDKVLRQFAYVLRSTVRVEDVVARYGGDEFTVLLPNTALADAKIVADRLQQAWADKVFDIDGEAKTFSASFGLTTYCGEKPVPHTDELIAHADRALYMAKENGKNQVAAKTWAESTPEPEEEPAAAAT